VALVKGDEISFQASHNDGLAHGEVLPKLVAQALSLTNKVDLVAVGMGPGPFTGLRVGIAFAQSYAFTCPNRLGWSLPLVCLAGGN
jgi:tRNA A37 threonylcarbamoyladenosine modification protein TsaB